MTVKCKHGTEVYKFRCPECADEERGRNMTADKFDSADGRTHDVSELFDVDAMRDMRKQHHIAIPIIRDKINKIKTHPNANEAQVADAQVLEILVNYADCLNTDFAAAEQRCKELEEAVGLLREVKSDLWALDDFLLSMLTLDSWPDAQRDALKDAKVVSSRVLNRALATSDDIVAKIKEAVDG